MEIVVTFFFLRPPIAFFVYSFVTPRSHTHTGHTRVQSHTRTHTPAPPHPTAQQGTRLEAHKITNTHSTHTQVQALVA